MDNDDIFLSTSLFDDAIDELLRDDNPPASSSAGSAADSVAAANHLAPPPPPPARKLKRQRLERPAVPTFGAFTETSASASAAPSTPPFRGGSSSSAPSLLRPPVLPLSSTSAATRAYPTLTSPADAGPADALLAAVRARAPAKAFGVTQPSACCQFHVIFLIDISGSMMLDGRLPAAFSALKTFASSLAKLSGGDDMICSIAVFNEKYEVKATRIRFGTEFKSVVSRLAKETVPRGGGRYVAALRGLKYLASADGTMDIGVLLSDGTPTEELNDHNTDPIYDAMDSLRADHGCVLYTVGLGKFDSRHLKELARTGGGEFFENTSIMSLETTFTRLSVCVSTLRGTVMSFGTTALKPLPAPRMEPEDAWKSSTPEMWYERQVYMMLPRKDGPSEGILERAGDARTVRLHKRAFAMGALRYAFHLFLPHMTAKGKELHLVLKESKFDIAQDTPQQVASAFLNNHRRAQELEKAFNAACSAALEASAKSSQVSFVPAFVVQLSDEKAAGGFRSVTAERYIPGRYVKMNGNDGFVNTHGVDAHVADVAAAFSHFTFDHTSGAELCVDIQGVGLQWTDPQLHSTSKRFGPADLGPQGMRRFFASHRCTPLCHKLRLRRVDNGLNVGAPLDPAMPVQAAPSRVDWAAAARPNPTAACAASAAARAAVGRGYAPIWLDP